ncbi:MAG TPA: LLM class flavin-dependent oxidoreductase [Candidatus Tectomicrobia bacterium]|nr:LLM class flavin-dependent oxidoreductase [Candidatus Tectomicrobia bacterium]
MKVRFGFTCRGQADLALDDFPQLVDDLERLGFDSIWLPERMLNGPFDPLVGLAHAAARTERLKLGAYVVVPGRNPVRLARALANLDRLSSGRLLLIMVLGQPDAPEVMAQHVTKAERGGLLEETIPLLRRLWSGEVVHHNGPRYQLRDTRLSPTPVQVPLDMWLGGQLPSALRRAGRLGDGWIPGLLTPTEAAEKRGRVEAAAAEAGRTIDPEHFGVNLTYSRGPLPVGVVEQLRRRRPDLDPADLVPQTRTALHARVDEWLALGFSKFILRPAAPPTDWTAELETLAEDILERQT